MVLSDAFRLDFQHAEIVDATSLTAAPTLQSICMTP